jgi:hypothetical protein
MSSAINQAVYRVRRFYHKDDKPKKYQCTYEIIDEPTQQVLAICDLIGKAVFSTLTIFDRNDLSWQIKPNRRIMPSRWVVTDPKQHVAMQFDQKILGKMANPIYKVVLAMLDENEEEIYRLVDPRSNIPDRIFGVNPGEWTIMHSDKPVAKLGWLKKQKDQPTGLFGRLRNLLTTSDRAIISAGSDHILPAPVALGMFMLFKELTDRSAA